MYQRSGDVGLGVPFNIASYSFLTHLIAKHCGLEASEFLYYLGNTHIYDDHLLALKETKIFKNIYERKCDLKKRKNINLISEKTDS